MKKTSVFFIKLFLTNFRYLLQILNLIIGLGIFAAYIYVEVFSSETTFTRFKTRILILQRCNR